MSSAIQDVAQQQSEQYAILKESLKNAGYSYREYANVVNIANLDSRTKDVFARLNQAIEAPVTKNNNNKPSQQSEASFSLG